MSQPLRIACHGWVGKQSGSVASANFLILEELLKRGFQIDFYGWGNSPESKEMFEYKNFNYIAIPYKSLIYSFFSTLPNNSLSEALVKNVYSLLHLLFMYNSGYRATRDEMIARHQAKSYDLILFLGLYAPFRLENIPVISWPQGPPKTNWFFIQKVKEKVISLCGIIFYLKLMFFYFIRDLRARAEVRNSDILIGGSQWSKEQLVLFGVPSHTIWSLPYPIDIKLFQLDNLSFKQKPKDAKVFLWLGRIEPRKRLDLLLEAYTLLLKERQDVHLKIIGGFMKGYEKLIDRFEFPDYLEYQPSIDRLKVPELMSQCDILIQPSEGENFGSSVAEALCYGLPVIVGPTNGTKDYISPSSFIFDAYEPESLKETMLQAIQAIEQDREKLAVEARQTAEENFSVARVVDCLEDIFQTSQALYQ
jgi:glycosyltransferase involved in cell wall biosynthesis